MQERQDFNCIFKSQFKQLYNRVFCHHFNFETLRIEDSVKDQKSSTATISNLHFILQPFSCERRRAFRRPRNTGGNTILNSYIITKSYQPCISIGWVHTLSDQQATQAHSQSKQMTWMLAILIRRGADCSVPVVKVRG